MKKIKLAIVGCGRVSQTHFDAIKANSDLIELIAICDRNPPKLEKAQKQFPNARTYTNYDQMLAFEKQLDAVSLATPNGAHSIQGIEAAKKGYHVITEKPLAVHWKDGLNLIRECGKNNKRLFLIHQNRLNPTVAAVKKAIDEGRFGRIYMITSNVFWHHKQSYYTDVPWHGTRDIDGGLFMTQASHYTDIMQWFAKGKASSIFANLKTLARDIETEDTGSAIIEWDNGVIGNINSTILTYKENYEGSITVIGEKGLVRLGGQALNEIKEWKFSDTRPEDKDIEKLNYKPENRYGLGHIPFYRNIANSLLNGEDMMIDEKEALKSLEVLCAILKSCEKGKPIKLPLSR